VAEKSVATTPKRPHGKLDIAARLDPRFMKPYKICSQKASANVLSNTVFEVYSVLSFGGVSLLVFVHTDQKPPLPWHCNKRFLRHDHDLPFRPQAQTIAGPIPLHMVIDQTPHTERALTGSIYE